MRLPSTPETFGTPSFRSPETTYRAEDHEQSVFKIKVRTPYNKEPAVAVTQIQGDSGATLHADVVSIAAAQSGAISELSSPQLARHLLATCGPRKNPPSPRTPLPPVTPCGRTKSPLGPPTPLTPRTPLTPVLSFDKITPSLNEGQLAQVDILRGMSIQVFDDAQGISDDKTLEVSVDEPEVKPGGDHLCHELSLKITVNHPKDRPPSIFCQVTVPRYHRPAPLFSSTRWMLLMLFLVPFVGAFSPAPLGKFGSKWLRHVEKLRRTRYTDAGLDVSFLVEDFDLSLDYSPDVPSSENFELPEARSAEFLHLDGWALSSFHRMKLEALNNHRVMEAGISRNIKLWKRLAAVKTTKHLDGFQASQDAILQGTAETTALDAVHILGGLTHDILDLDEAQATLVGAVAQGMFFNATSAVFTGDGFKVSDLCEPHVVARWIIRYSIVPTAAHTSMDKLAHAILHTCPWTAQIVQHIH